MAYYKYIVINIWARFRYGLTTGHNNKINNAPLRVNIIVVLYISLILFHFFVLLFFSLPLLLLPVAGNGYQRGSRTGKHTACSVSSYPRPHPPYTKQQNLLHSQDAPLPEYKTQALKKSRFILSHYGMFKGCWDWLILVATFYVAVAVPYNAAFAKTDRLTMASDVIVEALFIVGKLLDHAHH